MSDSMHQRFVELGAERGTIYSEDGQMLSTSIPYFDIYMDFGAEGLRDKSGKRFRENLDSFSYALASYFGDKSKAQYKRELQRAYNEKQRYYLLQKGINFDQFKSFRQFPLARLGRNKSGVIVEVRTKRLNPLGLLARRTIGLARENAQNVGLERTYDTLLKGTTGKRLVRFIAGGAAVPVEGYEIDPENGKDIITTLDVNIQDIAETALMKMLVQSDAQYGTCIVMETATGKIKAIANLGATKKGAYDENLNYALQTTEPGSTIKLATLLAVLDAGSSTINDLVEVGTTGNQFVAVRNVTDAERSPKAVLTVLPRWKRNKEGLHAMLTMSFGYAIEVSPLHTLMLYNAVANGGKLLQPYLVNSIKNNGIVLQEFEPVVLEAALCKPEVIKAAQQCMEAVVTEGTGKPAFADCPFPVAGKTGTAHVAGGNVKYYDGVYQASFAGYFPANNPQYTCIVVIKTKPHAAQHYGGQLAAPVFKEVATKLYARYIQQKIQTPVPVVADSVERKFAGNTSDIREILEEFGMQYKDSGNKQPWSVVTENRRQTVIKPALAGKVQMPDVRNMTLKDALYLLEEKGLKVTAKGKGKVLMQDIAPGSNISKTTTVTLLLN
jgi:cell division protein FtsI (penicillin-binding protein 3)